MLETKTALERGRGGIMKFSEKNVRMAAIGTGLYCLPGKGGLVLSLRNGIEQLRLSVEGEEVSIYTQFYHLDRIVKKFLLRLFESDEEKMLSGLIFPPSINVGQCPNCGDYDCGYDSEGRPLSCVSCG